MAARSIPYQHLKYLHCYEDLLMLLLVMVNGITGCFFYFVAIFPLCVNLFSACSFGLHYFFTKLS